MESKPDQPNNRLLIVDDEEAMRESLKALFQDQYEIEVCSTGEEAIALSRKEPFTIALIDMMMEGMLGVEVLKELDPIRKAFRAGGLRFSATGGPAYGWQVSGFRLPALPMSRY